MKAVGWPLWPHGWWFHWQCLGYCAWFLLGYLSPALPLLPGWGVPLVGSVGRGSQAADSGRVLTTPGPQCSLALGAPLIMGKQVHSLGSLTLCSVLGGEADHPRGGVIPA